MARPHLLPAQAQSWNAQTRTSVDDLIRPGLTQAFPLPVAPQADEKFDQILKALTQVRTGTS